MNIPTFLVLAANWLTIQSREESQDLATLQGEWALMETADAKGPDRGAEAIRMVIKRYTMTMLFGGLETNRGTMALGLSKGVRIIDMKFANGKSVLGVYELAGDLLTICVAEGGNARPGSLAPRGTQWLEKWKRAQPGHE